MPPRSLTTRDRILDAAETAFYADGVRATGVDALAERAGVTKMTLYRHFPSKDDVVAAWLVRHDERWRAWLEARVRTLSRRPERRLFALFDALGEWFATDDFRGSSFLNASVEYPALAHPVRLICRDHKVQLRRYVRGLVVDAAPARVDRLTDEVMLLLDGAIATALVEDHRSAARVARHAVARLLSA